jgi:hypothetical protein
MFLHTFYPLNGRLLPHQPLLYAGLTDNRAQLPEAFGAGDEQK